MKADLLFDNVEFEQNSEQSVRVVLGDDGAFTMVLKEIGDQEIRWATIGDPILDLREAPDRLSAKVITTALGKGEIQIQNPARGVLFWLGVEVYSLGQATQITITVGTPQVK